MGQNSSRQRRTALTSSSTTDPSPVSQEQVSEPTSAPPPRRSRRESVRRSILNLVKPSVRVESPAGSSRKSWRSSRRWSRAPPELESHAESSQSASSSTAPPSPINEKGKGVDRDPDTLSVHQRPEGDDRPSSSSSTISETTPAEVAETTVADAEEAGDHTGTAEATPTPAPPELGDQDEVVISPDPQLDSTPPEPQVENIQDGLADSQAPPAQEPPAHQFPPPGTLVVVQGVVHTTDVPRPSAPSAPQPETSESAPRSSSTPPTTRNRLSTLLQSRPGSVVGSRPASTIGTLPLPNNQTSTTLDATLTSDGHQVDPVEPQTDLPNSNVSSTNPPAQSPSSNDGASGTISSGSIDVLGTLLSVAAAATAASLLTGTSQPLLLPSSLGPPAYDADSSAATASAATTSTPGPSEPATSRPTSPTPTAGLGLDASRAERLRQAWGSIRERLGLRPAPPSSSNPTSTSASETELPTTSPSTDPREHLFGQMARAFNLGLGLASESASAPSPVSASGTDSRSEEEEQAAAGASAGNASDRQPPAEGSFERFLIDLQTDLRVALTNATEPSADTRASGEAESNAAEASAPRRPPSFAAPSTDDSHSDNAGDEDDVDEVSDSDSEFEDAHDEESHSDEGVPVIPAFSLDADPSRDPHGESTQDSSTSTTNPLGAASAETGTTQGSIPEVDAQGRINWWRLYRFPPITIPPAQGIPAAATTPSPSAPPAQASTSSSSPISSSLPMDPTFAELPFADADTLSPQPQPSPPPRAFSVVPVIVVGVQSVNANWQSQPPMEEDQDGTDEAASAPAEGDAMGTSQPRIRGRGRGWHSRAAEAIRSLRPGRRNRNAAPANTPGSRTFLIYVIGGYYPPNHSILNGGPDTLASLEALLELADLLGHAKPATVTKEDIEKSGLEIIKSTQLEQYEKEEKISSNCTERCLICLDDYQPEDDIRVMKCRHAFHQTCVDKWLETGRNNCPACRSKGVSVDES
ncbi:putative RING-like zinc finger [Lyophyllum shimeji]|uniref:RING-like zinc finger n=1 Tax=Lyophyllum shimeji TaxID=47721 RepID=A0A9P3Q0S3_LYOSH|nr:putative RING-like zinc finger [Lyophyllum shimeji]